MESLHLKSISNLSHFLYFVTQTCYKFMILLNLSGKKSVYSDMERYINSGHQIEISSNLRTSKLYIEEEKTFLIKLMNEH